MKLAILVVLIGALCVNANFHVKFDVQTAQGPGSFTMLVHDDWAPVGAAHFKKLVEAKHYDDIRFFRVIPSFMVQFGISGSPTDALNTKSITDDKVIQSNKPGTVSFAATGSPNSRSSQIFINYADNSRLDGMGFAPFAEVEGNGMNVAKQIFNCGESPDQSLIQSQGNSYLDKAFPKLSKVIKARIVNAAGVELNQWEEGAASN